MTGGAVCSHSHIRRSSTTRVPLMVCQNLNQEGHLYCGALPLGTTIRINYGENAETFFHIDMILARTMCIKDFEDFIVYVGFYGIFLKSGNRSILVIHLCNKYCANILQEI